MADIDKTTGEIYTPSIDELALVVLPKVVQRCTHIKIEDGRGQEIIANICYGIARAMLKQSRKEGN